MADLDTRRYSAEVRERGPDGLWSPTKTYGEASIDLLAAEHPSAGWSRAATRIVALNPRDHTRVEITDDVHILLTRR
jgi:hypothetical protein